MSTTKCDLFPLNIFHQSSYSLQMYKGYILTTTRFSLVYLNNPFAIVTLSTHLEDKTTSPSTDFSNLIISSSYILKKLINSNSNETTTFQLGILSSGYRTTLKEQFLTQNSMPLSSCYTLICQQTQIIIHLVFDIILT